MYGFGGMHHRFEHTDKFFVQEGHPPRSNISYICIRHKYSKRYIMKRTLILLMALLVAGNPTDSDVTLEVTLPLEKLGRPVTALKDVWSGSGLVLKPDAEGMVRLAIPKDRQPRGGLAVFEL